MKIIIIKDYNKWKQNEIIEVADGYAKNFLIKKGYGLPVNKANKKQLEDRIKNENKEEQEKINIAINTKNFIEKLCFKTYLKVDEKNIVHGSITRKQIIHFLKENNVKLNDSKNISNIKVNFIGNTKVKIKIYKNIIAELQLEIRKEQ